MALMLGVTVVLGRCFHLHDERCRISRKGADTVKIQTINARLILS